MFEGCVVELLIRLDDVLFILFWGRVVFIQGRPCGFC